MNKTRPILFNGEMVRAILEGRKTQTRRILDLPTGWDFKASEAGPCVLGRITSPHPKKNRFGAFIRREIYRDSGKFEHDIVPCPYGQPGDRLWVRETWFQKGQYVMPMWPEAEPEDATWSGKKEAAYAADEPNLQATGVFGELNWRKRPSIHMPRWASRITLEITDVRVERLQEISAGDAKAEGVAAPDLNGWCDDDKWFSQFAWLWRSINGLDSWDANPWVWVIEFKRIEQETKAA